MKLSSVTSAIIEITHGGEYIATLAAGKQRLDTVIRSPDSDLLVNILRSLGVRAHAPTIGDDDVESIVSAINA